MFALNTFHSGTRLFDFTNSLPEKIQEGLSVSWAKIFYEEVFCKIDEKRFASLYSNVKSRPNFPVNVLIGMEILRGIYDLSDQELLDNYRYNLLYMVALGMNNIGELPIAERTLYYFRARFNKFMSKEENLPLLKQLFDTLRDNFIRRAKVTTKVQRADSSMIAANIKKLLRYELVLKVARNLLKVLEEQDKQYLTEEILSIVERSKNETIFDIFANIDKSEVVIKGLTILNQVVETFKGNERIRSKLQYKQAERLLREQTKNPEEGETFEVKPGKEIESNSMQSPVDEDATYRKKSGVEFHGYVANVVETASKENVVQFITSVVVETNIVSDPELLSRQISELKTTTGVEIIVADGAYYSESLEKEAKNNNVELFRTNMTGDIPDENKISYNQFIINDKNEVVECPNKIKPTKSKYKEIKEEYTVYFENSQCDICPLKDRCRVKHQKGNSVLRFTKKKYELSKQRDNMKTEDFKKLKNLRPGIEGTFSGLKRSQGLGLADSRTLLKVRYFAMFKFIGCNFKRYIKATKIALYSILIGLLDSFLRNFMPKIPKLDFQ